MRTWRTCSPPPAMRLRRSPEYERVLALRPDPPLAHLGLGMVLLSQGRAAEARLHLRAAANSSDPEIAQAARHLLAQ